MDGIRHGDKAQNNKQGVGIKHLDMNARIGRVKYALRAAYQSTHIDAQSAQVP
jgi:hypothetical protein